MRLKISPGSRYFLVDWTNLERDAPGCCVCVQDAGEGEQPKALTLVVEGVEDTPVVFWCIAKR